MSNARAFWATAKRELLIRCRYPDWFVAMLLWPILMPTFTVFAVQALAGPDNSGGRLFTELAGTTDYIGFVFIGIVMWAWLNTVLWQVGATLRTEQRRGFPGFCGNFRLLLLRDGGSFHVLLHCSRILGNGLFH